MTRGIVCVAMLGLLLLVAPARAQVVLEFATNATLANSGPTGNVPTVTAQVVTLRHNTNNPSGNDMVVRAPAVTATFSLINQQFTGLSEAQGYVASTGGNAVFFGSILGTIQAPTFTDLYLNLGLPSGSDAAYYTSVNAANGQGVDLSANAGLYLTWTTRAIALQAPSTPTNARVRMVDLVVTFNMPVDNPILHFAGMGGAGSGFAPVLFTSAEFDLITPGLTLTRLSGSPAFAVTGSQINNGAPIPYAGCSERGACGSVRVNGTGITSVTFRTYLRGDGGGGSNGWNGYPDYIDYDGVLIGVSLAEPLPKVTVNKVSTGGVGTFNFTGSNGIASHAITTVTAGASVGGTTQTLAAANTVTTVTESEPPAGYALTDITCNGMGAGGTATNDLNARTVTLDAAATAPGSNIACTFTNKLPTTIRLQKQLTNGRVLDSDQFSLSMTGSGAPSAVVTTGSGSTISSAALTHAGAVPGTAYTLSEAASGTTVLSNYAATYACTNARAGGQTPSGSGTSFSITPVAGDDLTCTFSNAAPVMTTFGSCDGRLFLSQGDTTTGLYTLGAGANPLAATLIGSASQPAYNAVGYHISEHYLYAIAANSNTLVRIGGNGNTVNLGPVANLPMLAGGQSYVVGTLGNDGFMYVMHGAASTNLYQINVGTRVATLRTLSSAVALRDVGWLSGGNLYGVNAAGELLQIWSGGGAGSVTVLGPTGLSTAQQFSAMYSGSTHIYGYSEAGGFYKFDLTTGAATLIANSPAASNADGANCPTGNTTFAADLGITKTDGATGYTPGTNSVYTLVVSNSGPFGAQAARVQDALPSGITTANWTCVAANGAVCRTASGSGGIDALVDLPFNTTGAGATATFTLTMAVPTGFTGNLVNTATIAVGAGTTDSNSANNSATDTNTPATTLTLQKTWSGAQVNNAVTVSVTNPVGVGTALNAVANTAGETDAGTAFPVARGTTYTLTENFTTGAAANYTKTLTCTGNTGTGAAISYTADALSGTVTIGSTATSVVCTFGNSWLPTTIRLQKQLTNGRVQAGDQFSLSMSGSGAPAAVVTTGTGSTVSSAALTHAGAVPGSAYTLSEAASGTTVLANYTATYACTNARAGGQTPSGSGTSFSVTPVAGDDLTCTFSNAAPVMTSFGTCDGRLYRSQGSPSATSLYSLGTGANPLATTLIGPASQSPYDAIGYHPTDHFLYGIAAGNSNALVRIDSNGTQVNLGPITDLPILPGGQNYIVGEIGSDGFLYVMHGASSTNLYRINLTTRVATLRTLSTAVAFGDFAWVGGNLYAIDPAARQLLRIDPAGGAVTVVGPTNIASASQTGAMYGGPTNLYGIYETGGLYKFDLTTGAGTPIANVAGAASTDGAHCATADVSFTADLGITKTDGATGYTPGSNVVYTLVASNAGTFGAQRVRVQDALPSGITTANWTCTAANGAVCRTASGSGAIDTLVDLPFNTTGAGATATYALTLTVPSGFTGNLVNTATVTAGAGTTDSNSANNSATDTDTPAVADLSIQKTATPNPVVSGEQVVFTLVVTNSGPAPADGATVRDPAVAGLDCLEAGLPAPTCSATGGATCPSPLTVAGVQAGAVIPVLPNGGVVTLGMTCRATASGLP